MGGESRSTLPATDGGRPEDADGDDGDSDDTAATDIDIDEVVESAEGDSAVDAEDADSVSDDVEVPDDSDIPDAEMDDLPTDEDGVVRPNFDTSDRDFSEPADRVDTGDYAVDSRPSDADVPFGVGRGDANSADEADDETDGPATTTRATTTTRTTTTATRAVRRPAVGRISTGSTSSSGASRRGSRSRPSSPR